MNEIIEENETTTCEVCETVVPTSEIAELDGRNACTTCINNFHECSNCGNEYFSLDSDAESDRTYCCSRCEDEANESDDYDLDSGDLREHNEETDKFLSAVNVETSIVVSPRIFSAEIETISSGSRSIVEVASVTDKSVGFIHDGSLDDGGIEIVTPRLSGEKGEKLIKDLCRELHEHNFTVNQSCGLHVHLDIPEIKNLDKSDIDLNKPELENDFKNSLCRPSKTEWVDTEDTTVATVDPTPTDFAEEMTISYRNHFGARRIGIAPNGNLIYLNSNSRGEKRVLVPQQPFADIEKATGSGFCKFITVKLKDMGETEILQERAKEILKDHLHELSQESAGKIVSFLKKSQRALQDYYNSYDRPSTLSFDNFPVVSYDAETIRRKVLEKYAPNKRETTDFLKRVMLFHLRYEDVILSLVPRSRALNRYCIPLSELFHAQEIQNCNSLPQFEKLWYRDNDALRREQRKENKYDGTRYCGINFHSLLSHGHIEIRFHSGTNDAKKILHWTALHTAILDFCRDQSMPNGKLRDMKEKTKELFAILLDKKLIKQETVDFLLKRQEKFLTASDDQE